MKNSSNLQNVFVPTVTVLLVIGLHEIQSNDKKKNTSQNFAKYALNSVKERKVIKNRVEKLKICNDSLHL